MNPTISIITICFNNLEEVIATCQSIDNQSTPPHEHWIIDGSSNNEIRDYLQQHSLPTYRKWISERDKGIADAFNKGVKRATGEIVNMLNSGDRYIDENVLRIVAETFTNHPGVQWVHGKYLFNRSDKWIVIGKPFEKDKLYRGMRSICHQTMFARRTLHDKYGLYNTSLTIAMDYDFVCRIYKEPFFFIPEPLVVMAPEGISAKGYLLSLRQNKEIYTKYFGPSVLLNLWQLRLKLLHHMLQTRLGKFLFKWKTKLKLENM